MRRSAARILAAALEAADPGPLVARHLVVRGTVLRCGRWTHRLGRGRVILIAVGKAAPAMAAAAEGRLGRHVTRALAVSTARTRRLRRTRLLLAAHPVPDRRGLAAARSVENAVRGLSREDLVLLLLSGGASALLPAPAPAIRLEDKAVVSRALLEAGATIHELNAVRKHLSRLKGGGLARAARPARVLALVLSDVVGDDLATIGSGLVSPDPTTYADALAVLKRRRVRAPHGVGRHLRKGAAGLLPETAKPGDPLFRRVRVQLVGSNRVSVEAAQRRARRLGFRTAVVTTRLQGEARDVGRGLVGTLRRCVIHGRPVRPPACLVAGGETTVTVRGAGRGGRNQELVVAAIPGLARLPECAIASLATDGIDGASRAAGGYADSESLRRAARLDLPAPGKFLRNNDSESFLAALGDLIVTGPTGTNVNDVTVLLCGRREGV